MSITSELRNPKSAASLWLAENFDLKPIISLLAAQGKGLATTTQGGDPKGYPWSTVGHAVELRLRQRCGIQWRPRGYTNSPTFEWALVALWDYHQREQRTSHENAWVMYFAGLCEGMSRSGNGNALMMYQETFDYMEDSDEWAAFRGDLIYFTILGGEIKFDVNSYPCLKQLPEQMKVSEVVLNDISEVSDVAMNSENFKAIRHLGGYIDNPVISGSEWAGGAEADFISGHTLYEIKTTIRLERFWLPTIRQLISYVALDAGDEYRIDELAIFLPRQHGAVAKVALDEILEHSTFSSRDEMQKSLRRVSEEGDTVLSRRR